IDRNLIRTTPTHWTLHSRNVSTSCQPHQPHSQYSPIHDSPAKLSRSVLDRYTSRRPHHAHVSGNGSPRQTMCAAIERQRSTGSGITAIIRQPPTRTARRLRSEEHTSELQSRENLVCRLL